VHAAAPASFPIWPMKPSSARHGLVLEETLVKVRGEGEVELRCGHPHPNPEVPCQLREGAIYSPMVSRRCSRLPVKKRGCAVADVLPRGRCWIKGSRTDDAPEGTQGQLRRRPPTRREGRRRAMREKRKGCACSGEENPSRDEGERAAERFVAGCLGGWVMPTSQRNRTTQAH
jgi:hypothetical protein